jgi:hypothetical protein
MNDSHHFMECVNCGKPFDMRDLSQVIHHEIADCLHSDTPKDIPFTSSRRVGEPEQYLKSGETLNLN